MLSGFAIGSGLNYLMGFAGPLYIYAGIFVLISFYLYTLLHDDNDLN